MLMVVPRSPQPPFLVVFDDSPYPLHAQTHQSLEVALQKSQSTRHGLGLHDQNVQDGTLYVQTEVVTSTPGG